MLGATCSRTLSEQSSILPSDLQFGYVSEYEYVYDRVCGCGCSFACCYGDGGDDEDEKRT